MARWNPEEGDIVIRQDAGGGERTYILRAAPGPDQYLLHARDDAVARAITFAKRRRVRVWLTNGDRDFTLLDDFRVGVEAI